MARISSQFFSLSLLLIAFDMVWARFPESGDIVTLGRDEYRVEKVLNAFLPASDQLNELRRTRKSIVYRAVRSRDQKKVTIRIMLAETDVAMVNQLDLLLENILDYSEARGEREETILPEISYARLDRQGYHYHAFVTDYIDGISLREWIDGEHSVEERFEMAWKFLIQSGSFLAELLELGETGFVLRDLKPANLVVTPEGNIEPIDLEGVSPIVPLTFSVQQTLSYMPPEAKKSSLNAAYDLWARSLVAYEILVGRSPFPKIVDDKSRSVREWEAKEYDHFLEKIVERNSSEAAEFFSGLEENLEVVKSELGLSYQERMEMMFDAIVSGLIVSPKLRLGETIDADPSVQLKEALLRHAEKLGLKLSICDYLEELNLQVDSLKEAVGS